MSRLKVIKFGEVQQNQQTESRVLNDACKAIDQIGKNNRLLRSQNNIINETYFGVRILDEKLDRVDEKIDNVDEKVDKVDKTVTNIEDVAATNFQNIEENFQNIEKNFQNIEKRLLRQEAMNNLKDRRQASTFCRNVGTVAVGAAVILLLCFFHIGFVFFGASISAYGVYRIYADSNRPITEEEIKVEMAEILKKRN